MLRKTAIATLIFSGTVVLTDLPAQALGTYTFEGVPPFAATGVDANLTLSNFAATGLAAVGGTGLSGGFGGGLAINYSNWSTSTTVDPNNKYYSFTVTPNSSIQMSFSSLTFAAQRSGSGPTTIEVRSSLDSYTTTLSTSSPGNGSFISGLSTPVSGAAFQNLSTPVTFRIYGYSASAPGGTLRLDNVVLGGTTQATVPVPFGFTPIWGIAANGIVFGLRELRKRTKSGSQSINGNA